MVKKSSSSSVDVTRNCYQSGRSANNVYKMYEIRKENYFIMTTDVCAEYTHILVRNYGQSEIIS